MASRGLMTTSSGGVTKPPLAACQWTRHCHSRQAQTGSTCGATSPGKTRLGRSPFASLCATATLLDPKLLSRQATALKSWLQLASEYGGDTSGSSSTHSYPFPTSPRPDPSNECAAQFHDSYCRLSPCCSCLPSGPSPGHMSPPLACGSCLERYGASCPQQSKCALVAPRCPPSNNVLLVLWPPAPSQVLDPDAFLPFAAAVVTLVTFAVARLQNLKRSLAQARRMLREFLVRKLGKGLGTTVMNQTVNPLLEGKAVSTKHQRPPCSLPSHCCCHYFASAAHGDAAGWRCG